MTSMHSTWLSYFAKIVLFFAACYCVVTLLIWCGGWTVMWYWRVVIAVLFAACAGIAAYGEVTTGEL